MKEKELRIAVVLFGGVSLAVYQHGITREILSLVRASKVFHNEVAMGMDPASLPSFSYVYDDEPDESTGDIYLELLSAISPELNLRVIVDVIAGASAGGINGVTLATALARDLSLRPLTEMWLAQADMLNLLSPEVRTKAWSKWYIWPVLPPLLAKLTREGLIPLEDYAEIRERIAAFMRSRWFKPPLDGRQLASHVLDGLMRMQQSGKSQESLLPPGTKLDLLVTATDFRGIERPIYMHDPEIAHEREHRIVLRFSLEQRRVGRSASDFEADNFPSLAFAARATACFPGAFAPAQIGEMDALLAERRIPWPGRTRFLEQNFEDYLARGESPESAVLLDGSVLDNKPIMACVQAIRAHSAFRELDRHLVYIDPRPVRDRRTAGPGAPGFFSTLRAALSDLPRHDPVYKELAQISQYNRQASRLKAAISDARPHVALAIESTTGGRLVEKFSPAELGQWRIRAMSELSGTAVVYNAWTRSLVLEGLDFIVRIITTSCRMGPESRQASVVQEIIEEWARQQGILSQNYYVAPGYTHEDDYPEHLKVIINFGIVYKKRRLNFVIHEINNLYSKSTDRAWGVKPECLDVLKIRLQKVIDDLTACEDISTLSRHAVSACQILFSKSEDFKKAKFDTINDDNLLQDITKLVERLALECDLTRANENSDSILASATMFELGERSRVAILTAYLGYLYWDIILRPTASALALDRGPIDEILIDRISPEDTNLLKLQPGVDTLRGATFGGFGGFLGRGARENDYLWGRLHGADRLIDIVCSGLTQDQYKDVDVRAMKRRLFERILNEESAKLSSCSELIGLLRKAISEL